MKFIITGSSGFIGKRLCYFLEKEGFDIIRILRNNLINSKKDILCDLENEVLKEGIFYNVDTVIHLAGYAHDILPTKKSEISHTKLNFEATKRIAFQASREGVKNFLFLSSVKASCFESSPKDSSEHMSIYGRTKRNAELELLKLSSETDMKICIIRPSLVYGPEVKGNLLQMKKAIELGWFPPLPKINNSKSMVHVDDLVRAIYLIERKGENGQIYNVTDGKIYSSTEIYEIFCKLIKKNLPKFRFPLFFLKILTYVPGKIGQKIQKLMENETYSSKKIQSLGFNAKLEFKNLNETLF